jgi:hypothetical protein
MASRVLFAAFVVIASWLGMQGVHEFGHAVVAWATGGRVERVVLLPWSISRTDVSQNPHPLAVVWGGPVFGVAVPLVAWGILKLRRSSLVPAIRFFAGFCLVANGLYLGMGSFGEGIGDAADLLRLGAPRWCLMLFGVITVPCGLVLWHGQGRALGMVEGSVPPSRSAVQAAAAGALGTAVGGMLVTWLGR